MKQAVESDLHDLERRVEYDLSCLTYPGRFWVPETHNGEDPVYNVLIVGGGQSGITLGLKLHSECVPHVKIVDRNSKYREGPWRNYARMPTLRTPKNVTGPELGVPSLSVKAWWEAKYGAQSWEELNKIPTEQWAEYLGWLREITGIEIENNTEVYDIEPLENNLFAVHARSTPSSKQGDGKQTFYARTIVLATGIEGSGQWTVPEIVSKNIPKELYAHTSEMIDFAGLEGKQVAVIGAGASAFDNAAEALEYGAAAVDLFARRKQLPTINPYRWMEYSGFLRHFGDLDDKDKWRFMKYLFEMNQPPPQDTYRRASRFDNFTVHLDSPIKDAGFSGERLWLQTPQRRFDFDFLIVGTGFKVDLCLRPELRRFSDKVALWSDRYRPEKSEKDVVLASYPYMSPYFQLTEKEPGAAPFLKNIFTYSYGSIVSLAASAGISALKFGMDRLSVGITRELFRADANYHFASLQAFNDKELKINQ